MEVFKVLKSSIGGVDKIYIISKDTGEPELVYEDNKNLNNILFTSHFSKVSFINKILVLKEQNIHNKAALRPLTIGTL